MSSTSVVFKVMSTSHKKQNYLNYLKYNTLKSLARGLEAHSLSAAQTTQGRIFKMDAGRGTEIKGIMHLDHLSAIRSLLAPHLPPPGL